MKSLVDQVASAVLYEGYILYPYRPSVKNRQRWTFGGLFPRAWVETSANGDAAVMQTECLVTGTGDAVLSVSVRFLHLISRTVGEFAPPLADWPADREPKFRPVEALRIGDRLYQTWEEAAEREVDAGEFKVAALATVQRHDFAFPAFRTLEPLRESDGRIAGVLERRQHAIKGGVEISAVPIQDGLFKVTIRISNDTPMTGCTREEAQLFSLVSTHAVLEVRDGEFISLTDPPEEFQEAARGSSNVGCWPVLVGNEGETNTLLASPIILPDYPRIAPESPGDLFDGAEIDEILTLRILTLTDGEKQAAMAVDERARRMLERTEALARDQIAGLHGAIRGVTT